MVYRYEVGSRQQTVWTRPAVPVDSANFEVKQVWVTSKDGTKVPMFLVYSKGMKQDGARPTVLTGYGGFVVSNTPHFSSGAILFSERGGVYALANLRGGGEFGEAWHKAGMRDKKQNVFDDFIAASEWLIQNNYTQPSKLSILGGSNGGLLVGAALTQHPELYQAVVCWHPLLDMLRYDKFMEAQFWVSEYGSANNAEQFRWLYAYSPYHHVKPGVDYPAVLFMTGDGDTRVAPLHARKMTALLQWATSSSRPILLRYELTAGHSAGRSVSQGIGDALDELSFLFWQLGVAP
jgi:prolyl oligopeptidase